MKKNNSQPTNNDYIVNYTKIKNNRIEFLNNNFSGKKHKKRKTPWYMLTSGRVYNFEQHSEKFGQCVDFYRVDSETKKLNKKNTINKKLKRAEFMEAMAQHKLAKWIKKHPAPCDERDLFKYEFLDPWKEERDKALERFRDFVVATYCKVKLYGRFSENDHGYSKLIGEIPIKSNELFGKKIADLSTDSVIINKACNMVNIERAKNPKFIAGRLVDPDGTHGMIIIPKFAA